MTKAIESITALIERQGAGLLGPEFALLGSQEIDGRQEIAFLSPAIVIRLSLEPRQDGNVLVRAWSRSSAATAAPGATLTPGREGWYLLSLFYLEANLGIWEVEELISRVRASFAVDRRRQARLDQ